MRDDSTTLRELKTLVHQFVQERSWQRFHSPKNLAMSVSIEAAELMEHFQWHAAEGNAGDAAIDRTAVAHEIADVAAYLIALANVLDIDLAEAIEAKMALNRKKYPADQYQGRYKIDE